MMVTEKMLENDKCLFKRCYEIYKEVGESREALQKRCRVSQPWKKNGRDLCKQRLRKCLLLGKRYEPSQKSKENVEGIGNSTIGLRCERESDLILPLKPWN